MKFSKKPRDEENMRLGNIRFLPPARVRASALLRNCRHRVEGLIRRGENDQAQADLTAALQFCPRGSDLWRLQQELNLARTSPPAVRLLPIPELSPLPEAPAATAPSGPELPEKELFEKAWVSFNREDYPRAAEEFRAAYEMNPRDMAVLILWHISCLRRDFQSATEEERKMWEFTLIKRAESTLLSKVKVIRFLRARPSLSFCQLEAERKTNRESEEIYGLVSKHHRTRVFNNFHDAAVAAGVKKDSAAFHRVRGEINRDFAGTAGVPAIGILREKRKLLAQAEELYGNGDYTRAEAIFTTASTLHADDIAILCFIHFCRLAAAAISSSPAGEIAKRATKKLQGNLKVIEFFRNHDWRSHKIQRERSDIFCLMLGSPFEIVSRARVAAGIRANPAVLGTIKAKMGAQFEEDYRRMTAAVRGAEEEARAEQSRQAEAAEKRAARLRLQEEKAPRFAAGVGEFLGGRYPSAALSFRKIFEELDPADIRARCYYYLSLLHQGYPALERFRPNYRGRRGLGRGLQIVHAARKLRQRIVILEELERNPLTSTALRRRRHESVLWRHMFCWLYTSKGPKPKRAKPFSGIPEARIAAGIDSNPKVLERIIREIDKEAKFYSHPS